MAATTPRWLTWVNALEQYFNAIDVGLGIGSDGFCALGDAGARDHAAAGNVRRIA